MTTRSIITARGLPVLALALFAQPAARPTDVLTQHNNPARTGANLAETILTPANVTRAGFGKLFDLPVDGYIYAQPLVVGGLNLRGKSRHVVFVATAHNSVYAFDADTGEDLWMRNYGPPMPTPSTYFPNVGGSTPYHDLIPEIGITSTPVIDRATLTMYFTSYTQERVLMDPFVTFHYSLHAVNLLDGAEKFGGPAEIHGCLTSPAAMMVNQGKMHSGRHYVNPLLCFSPRQELQRPALALVQPAGGPQQVVLAFGSHADYQPFYGWVMTYQADRIQKQLGLWVSSADNTVEGNGGGIWQSGMGPAVDENGNFYLMTGNGFFDGNTSFGESVLRFSTSGGRLAMQDYFTPCNQGALDQNDTDVGSSGPLLLLDPKMSPRPDLLIGGGKQGRIYVLHKDNLGKMQTCQKGACNDPLAAANPPDCDPQAPQEFQAVRSAAALSHHIHSSPVFWISPQRGPVIYVWGENDQLRAYPLARAEGAWRFQTFPDGKPPAWAVGAAHSPMDPWDPRKSMMTGGMLSLTANGGRDAIVWATTPTNNDANVKTVPGILRAYDANDLSRELWNSYQDQDEDDFGNYAKFTPVTAANGKVYVATFSGHLSIYGLRKPTPPAVRTNLLLNGGFEDGAANWTGTAGRFGSQINYPYHGKRNGVLCTTQPFETSNTVDVCGVTVAPVPQDSEVSQTVTAKATGRHTLRAFCATNILPNNQWLKSGEVQVGVDVNGRRARWHTVEANTGYQLYEIDFEAKQGDRIKVWYRAPGVETQGSLQINTLISIDAWAAIDDVALWGPQ